MACNCCNSDECPQVGSLGQCTLTAGALTDTELAAICGSGTGTGQITMTEIGRAFSGGAVFCLDPAIPPAQSTLTINVTGLQPGCVVLFHATWGETSNDVGGCGAGMGSSTAVQSVTGGVGTPSLIHTTEGFDGVGGTTIGESVWVAPVTAAGNGSVTLVWPGASPPPLPGMSQIQAFQICGDVDSANPIAGFVVDGVDVAANHPESQLITGSEMVLPAGDCPGVWLAGSRHSDYVGNPDGNPIGGFNVIGGVEVAEYVEQQHPFYSQLGQAGGTIDAGSFTPQSSMNIDNSYGPLMNQALFTGIRLNCSTGGSGGQADLKTCCATIANDICNEAEQATVDVSAAVTVTAAAGSNFTIQLLHNGNVVDSANAAGATVNATLTHSTLTPLIQPGASSAQQCYTIRLVCNSYAAGNNSVVCEEATVDLQILPGAVVVPVPCEKLPDSGAFFRMDPSDETTWNPAAAGVDEFQLIIEDRFNSGQTTGNHIQTFGLPNLTVNADGSIDARFTMDNGETRLLWLDSDTVANGVIPTLNAQYQFDPNALYSPPDAVDIHGLVDLNRSTALFFDGTRFSYAYIAKEVRIGPGCTPMCFSNTFQVEAWMAEPDPTAYGGSIHNPLGQNGSGPIGGFVGNNTFTLGSQYSPTPIQAGSALTANNQTDDIQLGSFALPAVGSWVTYATEFCIDPSGGGYVRAVYSVDGGECVTFVDHGADFGYYYTDSVINGKAYPTVQAYDFHQYPLVSQGGNPPNWTGTTTREHEFAGWYASTDPNCTVEDVCNHGRALLLADCSEEVTPPDCIITSQPSSVIGDIGDPVNFGGSVSGTEQWQQFVNGSWVNATEPTVVTAANQGTSWRLTCLEDPVFSVVVTITPPVSGGIATMSRTDADGVWDTTQVDDPMEQYCMTDCGGTISWWYRVADPVDANGWVDNPGWQELTGPAFAGQTCFSMTAPSMATVIAEDPVTFDTNTMTGLTDLDHTYTFQVQGRCDGAIVNTFTAQVPYDHIDEGTIP